MLLQSLQSTLADTYALSLDADVNDFLVTDRRIAESVLGDTARLEDEMLLIREDDDAVDVALYLNETLLGRLYEADPRAELHNDNLDDYCRVLEGVSHFVYLAWRAGHDRTVTRLELEVQAEIDKYLSARLLLEAQGEGLLSPAELIRSLFARFRFHAHLEGEELERYRCANDLASRYCNSLQERFPEPQVPVTMMRELRDFYRMSQPEKLSHLHSAQFA